MFFYFSSVPFEILERHEVLPSWLATFLRQSPTPRIGRWVAVAFCVAMALLSQAVIISVIAGLDFRTQVPSILLLGIELLGAILWSAFLFRRRNLA